jgi:hypothetical protein
MSEIIKGRKEATKISSFLIFEISVYFHIKKYFLGKSIELLCEKFCFVYLAKIT